MQPYFFPYLGYFELLYRSDLFIFYDDAAFSKNGWYNRNRILCRDKEWDYIRVAVQNAPLGTPCNEVMLANKGEDRRRIVNMLKYYKDAPYRDSVISLVEAVFDCSDNTLCSISAQSIINSARYLGLKAEIVFSSAIDYNRSHSSVRKVLEICKKAGATEYINLSGGRDLYNEQYFASEGMKLRFCSNMPFAYPQGKHANVASLSVLDAMMWGSPEEICLLFQERALDGKSNKGAGFSSG